MKSRKEFDIIIWGASGFTGRLVVTHLFKNYGVNNDLKWAMAGRNKKKLKQVRFSAADNSVPIIIADSNDEVSLKEMIIRTKVICTTVGPYATYGDKLVSLCVNQGTDYCDLSGEVQWMRKMIDQYHEIAKNNGVKIVHTCGFDSIPSDMGVYFTQRELQAQMGQPANKIEMRVAGISGGISGGTYASLTKVMEQAYFDKEVYKVLANPYGLNPKGKIEGNDTRDLNSIIYDDVSKSWIGPFVMAGINTKVVRRSNALSGYVYGKDFRYDEATICGKGLKGRIKGYLMAIPLLIMTAKPKSFLKKIIDKILPKPGEGPKKEKREKGFYNLKFYATLKDGSRVLVKVTGDMDPGYGSTSKMLGEAAVCLAKDNLSNISGVLTPSIAMGDFLLKRLENRSGLTFSFNIV
ncbi:MAG: saccharopine dehydrogenase [Flavobacteriaceae bacterium]|nr:saccharopine dehydrogenase [Flavobacteriaceae bacterium]